MTAPTLASLLAGLTSEETRDQLVQLATIAGFPATSWQSGSVPRTLFELESIPYSDLSRLIAQIASGGFLDFAEEGWLDLCAQQLYNLTRQPAVYARGLILLTDAESVGPVDITEAGQIFIESGGVRFRNIELGTLALDGTLELEFEAEFPGIAGNLPEGVTWTFSTSIPGLTAESSPPPGGSWLTQQGTEQESDPDLRARCRARWGELGYGATDLAYKFWVLTASAEITRVAVAEAVGDGTVSIYVAGPAGDISAPALEAAQDYVSARRPQCVQPTVIQAEALTVALAGSIKCRSGQTASAEVAVTAAMTAYFAALPLGATIYRAPLEAAILAAHSGILNVALTNAAEILLAANQVAVPSVAGLTFGT